MNWFETLVRNHRPYIVYNMHALSLSYSFLPAGNSIDGLAKYCRAADDVNIGATAHVVALIEKQKNTTRLMNAITSTLIFLTMAE